MFDDQTISERVDQGQMIELDCSSIFDFPLSPTYVWSSGGTTLANTAVYTFTAGSDATYECTANDMDFKGNDIEVEATVVITVNGKCSVLVYVYMHLLQSSLHNFMI